MIDYTAAASSSSFTPRLFETVATRLEQINIEWYTQI